MDKLNEQQIDFIKKFISSYEVEVNRYSCLTIALKDARLITGRNLVTGQHQLNILQNENNFISPYSFVGMINYLLILDMIGSIFLISGFKTKRSNIYNALKQFSSINDKEIDTIIALRNSLAHNYSLINLPWYKEEDSRKLHKFTLDNSENAELIKYPTNHIARNLIFSDKSESSSTIIGYRKIIDLIELVYENVKSKFENGFILYRLGVDELKARFTIRN